MNTTDSKGAHLLRAPELIKSIKRICESRFAHSPSGYSIVTDSYLDHRRKLFGKNGYVWNIALCITINRIDVFINPESLRRDKRDGDLILDYRNRGILVFQVERTEKQERQEPSVFRPGSWEKWVAKTDTEVKERLAHIHREQEQREQERKAREWEEKYGPIDDAALFDEEVM